MTKKTWLEIIGAISLLVALLLGIFVKVPFIDFVASSTKVSLSGSFSLLFLLVGIATIGDAIFTKHE